MAYCATRVQLPELFIDQAMNWAMKLKQALMQNLLILSITKKITNRNESRCSGMGMMEDTANAKANYRQKPTR